MRLNNFQISKIKESIYESFGKFVPIYLFGSRADDLKKGGDIDLLVITSQEGKDLQLKKMKAVSNIQLSIGDQKIDLITESPNNTNHSLIVSQGLKGIKL